MGGKRGPSVEFGGEEVVVGRGFEISLAGRSCEHHLVQVCFQAYRLRFEVHMKAVHTSYRLLCSIELGIKR